MLSSKKDGDVNAQHDYKLAMMHKDNAFKSLQLAAEEGCASAQFDLGMMYRAAGKKDEALTFIRSAARQGHSGAQFTLGRMCQTGQGLIKKYDQIAFELLRRAVIQEVPGALDAIKSAVKEKNAEARFNLALMYKEGQGVDQDYTQALSLFQLVIKKKARKEAEKKHASIQTYAKAQFNLGLMYKNSEGVKKNYNKAFELFLKAAVQGDAEVQFNLGLMYKNGEGVKKNYNEAFKLFLKAAVQGHTEAQNIVISEVISEIEKDELDVDKFFQGALKQEDVEVQFSLGLMYKNGQGVKQNKRKAFTLFQKSMNQGHTEAQNIVMSEDKQNSDHLYEEIPDSRCSEQSLYLKQRITEERKERYDLLRAEGPLGVFLKPIKENKPQHPETQDFGYEDMTENNNNKIQTLPTPSETQESRYLDMSKNNNNKIQTSRTPHKNFSEKKLDEKMVIEKLDEKYGQTGGFPNSKSISIEESGYEITIPPSMSSINTNKYQSESLKQSMSSLISLSSLDENIHVFQNNQALQTVDLKHSGSVVSKVSLDESSC